jgi:hypothetical protein
MAFKFSWIWCSNMESVCDLILYNLRTDKINIDDVTLCGQLWLGWQFLSLIIPFSYANKFVISMKTLLWPTYRALRTFVHWDKIIVLHEMLGAKLKYHLNCFSGYNQYTCRWYIYQQNFLKHFIKCFKFYETLTFLT